MSTTNTQIELNETLSIHTKKEVVVVVDREDGGDGYYTPTSFQPKVLGTRFCCCWLVLCVLWLLAVFVYERQVG